ncbi:MAG: glycosidase, partial [Chitinophagaceae bacterium]
MRIPIERKSVKVYPDPKRVIARFFFNGDERGKDVITKVLTLSDEQVFGIVSPLLQEYSKRHRNITKILLRHCKKLKSLFASMDIDYRELEEHRRLLIGSYFTHEYSIESAAFFNPSIIEDPDQTDLEDGEKRLIISFRAVGEGHISSIIFRRALIDRNNNITVIPAGDYIDEAEIIRNATYNKKLFLEKGLMSLIDKDVLEKLNAKLEDQFDYT